MQHKLEIEQINGQILQRKKENRKLESEVLEIEKKSLRINFLNRIVRSIIPSVVALGGVATAIIAAFTYAKSVNDTANDRFYTLLTQLAEYQEVNSENASTITVLISRLDSEFFGSEHFYSEYFSQSQNRGFEIAYVVIPFAKVFGPDLATVGVVSADVLPRAIARVNNLTHRNRLVADWGNYINYLQGKDTSSEYLDSIQKVVCELDLLSERVGARTSDSLEDCR